MQRVRKLSWDSWLYTVASTATDQGVSLPLAAKKPKLDFSRGLPALTVQKAQLYLTALQPAVIKNIHACSEDKQRKPIRGQTHARPVWKKTTLNKATMEDKRACTNGCGCLFRRRSKQNKQNGRNPSNWRLSSSRRPDAYFNVEVTQRIKQMRACKEVVAAMSTRRLLLDSR